VNGDKYCRYSTYEQTFDGLVLRHAGLGVDAIASLDHQCRVQQALMETPISDNHTIAHCQHSANDHRVSIPSR
jgi:hypothetical protein